MILKGRAASLGWVKTRAFVVHEGINYSDMQDGDAVIVKYASPEYFELYVKSSAIITEMGGVTCHAAVISREMNIPCVVSVENATNIIHTGDQLVVDGERGEINVQFNR